MDLRLHWNAEHEKNETVRSCEILWKLRSMGRAASQSNTIALQNLMQIQLSIHVHYLRKLFDHVGPCRFTVVIASRIIGMQLRGRLAAILTQRSDSRNEEEKLL